MDLSLLGDFNAKVRREDIFKPTVGDENLLKCSIDNGVGIVNFKQFGVNGMIT
jgi:hypothetical protein